MEADLQIAHENARQNHDRRLQARALRRLAATSANLARESHGVERDTLKQMAKWLSLQAQRLDADGR